MEKFVLTKDGEQILRDQVIDRDHPGTVLRDFETLLDFVGTAGVPAPGKHNLLPIGAIGELDRRLSRPLQLKLRRPQLRSHPYLQGLHLLLRASGLGTIVGVGSKTRLVVHAAVLDEWRRLNPTEQYFNLLEAWLRLGRAEMVGERGMQMSHCCFLASKPGRAFRPEVFASISIGSGMSFCVAFGGIFTSSP